MLHSLSFDLPTPEATDRLATVLAPGLVAGDAVLLEGAIGAGKSHLARAIIRARLDSPAEEVPSPTFTLVQTYPADPPIWHADLYRLGHPDEAMELGLDQAFAGAITLVEWPDRLGNDRPHDAITIKLAQLGEGRRALVTFAGRPALAASLRALALALFVESAGWARAQRQKLAGDASARSYQRLTWQGQSAVLMDNPPGLADRAQDFLKVGAHLASIGLSVPQVMAADKANGFLLLEDLGDARFADILRTEPGREAELYALATDLILALQSRPAPADLPDLSADDWAEAAMLSVSQYHRGITGQMADPEALRGALADALIRWGSGPKVLIHRDFHVENLMLLANREGLARVGVLDFQLAQMGHPAYDLVSLLQDARRDLGAGVEDRMKARFAAAARLPDFEAAYAVWGAQRALRILGIFARLCLVEGKSTYLAHMPRVAAALRRNLGHPALRELQAEVDRLIPDPTPDRLNRLRSQCATCR